MSPKILFAPYGTNLEEQERRLGIPGLADPRQIVNGPQYAKAITEVALASFGAGATAAMTNTFRVRHVLEEHGGEQSYREIISAHCRALEEAAISLSGDIRSQVSLALSLGPAAKNCYHPEQAPGFIEAREFHDAQAAAVAAQGGRYRGWFETVSTGDEARGIAAASRLRGIPPIISFVLNNEGNLLSGENPLHVISRIEDEYGHERPLGYGFNCSPIEGIQRALEKCGVVAQRRVLAVYPNASSRPQRKLEDQARTDHVHGVRDIFGMSAFLNHLAQRFHLGVIGGCCGFAPDDIAAISHAVRGEMMSERLPATDYDPEEWKEEV